MSFFHKRARSASAQRPQAPMSSSAHEAAARAYMANRNSQLNLSASAAATALRTMSPPPVPVGQIQTRRMLQRQLSGSSTGSASRGRHRDGLNRQNSSGSMTERTFRSPSPSHHQSQPRPTQAPPVPKVPDNYAQPRLRQVRNQGRSTSLDMNLGRAISPSITQPAGRGRTISVQDPQSFQKTAARRSAGMSQPGVMERQDSQNSINFSRPRTMSPQFNSAAIVNGVQRSPATVRDGISASEANIIQYGVSRVADQPVKKKKKKSAPQATEGRYLQAGSMDDRSRTAPFEPDADVMAQSPDTRQTTKKKKNAAAISGQSSHFPERQSPIPNESDSDSTPEKGRRTQRASGVLAKQPSVVREDWEGEQEPYAPVLSDARQREQQGLSPITSPATITTAKRNSSENVPKLSSPKNPPKLPFEFGPVHHAVTNDVSNSQPVESQFLTPDASQNPRVPSISPSRSARFSNSLSSDLVTKIKHEPLARSASPAKSALKQAQNPSPTDQQFPRPRGSSVTPSEASDSNISIDGTMRRKKSARVSFEAEPAILGTAAESVTSDSPLIVSPQNVEQAKKGWYGSGRGKPLLTTIPSDDNLNEGMQPRPQLPSFGSVRGKNRRKDVADGDDNTPSKQSETHNATTHQSVTASLPLSDALSSTNPFPNDPSASSDHNIGALLAHDVQDKQSHVSGTGHSNALSVSTEEVSDKGPAGPVTPISSRSTETSTNALLRAPDLSGVTIPSPTLSSSPKVDNNNVKTNVPTLSLQPPTPGIEIAGLSIPRDLYFVGVPGSFPLSETSSVSGGSPPGVSPAPSPVVAPVNIATKTAIPDTKAKQETPATPVNPRITPEDAASESDNDSIYSDAAEDMTVDEGDGFGSINAIIQTPTSAVKTPPESPLARNLPERPSEANRTASWDETQARWSGIAQSSREGTFVPPSRPAEPHNTTMAETDEIQAGSPTKARGTNSRVSAPTRPLDSPRAVTDQSPTHRSTTMPRSTDSPTGARNFRQPASPPASPPRSPEPYVSRRSPDPYASRRSPVPYAAPPSGVQQSMRAQPTYQSESKFRSSMRAPPPGFGGPRVKQSMRRDGGSQNEQGLRSAMRDPTRPRPISMGSVPQPLNIPVASRSQPVLPSPESPTFAIRRKPVPVSPTKPVQPFTHDSDSESSFKKSRKSKATSNEGRYMMRTSMRAGAPVAAGVPKQPVGRGNLRSQSPVSRQPFSSAMGQKTMRTSLRGTAGPTPAPRRQSEESRSSSLFRKSRKARSPPRPTQQPTSSRLRSRFVDSDDEDERPRQNTHFRSRFEDSSDEEPETTKFTPVRGIPRRTDEGDSTDLEDSSDEEKRLPKTKAKPLARIEIPAETASPIAPGPLTPTTMKKRGLFSRFRSKKEKDDAGKFVNSRAVKQRNAILDRTVSSPTVATLSPTLERPDLGQQFSHDVLSSKDLGFKSDADKDALVRQTMAKLTAARATEPDLTAATYRKPLSRSVTPSGPESPLQSQTSPPSGRLQRRVTPQRILSENWPAVPPLPEGMERQYLSSQTVPTLKQTNGSPARPFNERQQTSSTVRTEGGTVIYGRSGRKKRFPTLRRAFGLHD